MDRASWERLQQWSYPPTSSVAPQERVQAEKIATRERKMKKRQKSKKATRENDVPKSEEQQEPRKKEPQMTMYPDDVIVKKVRQRKVPKRAWILSGASAGFLIASGILQYVVFMAPANPNKRILFIYQTVASTFSWLFIILAAGACFTTLAYAHNKELVGRLYNAQRTANQQNAKPQSLATTAQAQVPPVVSVASQPTAKVPSVESASSQDIKHAETHEEITTHEAE